MFALTVFLNLIASIVMFTSLWGAHRREQAVANHAEQGQDNG